MRMIPAKFGVIIALAAFAMPSAAALATPIQRSPDPPAWTESSSKCVAELVNAEHLSGVTGYLGYNASLLIVVEHRHVPCSSAKRLARAEWAAGPSGQPLHWRYARAWRSTAGSAYVGDFVGTHGSKQVEFFAVH